VTKRQDRLTVPETLEFNPGGKRNRKHFLRHIIETHHIHHMIEVGVRDGRTTFYLLDHVPDLIITGVDIRISKFYTPAVAEQYGSRLRAMEGCSWTVADRIADGSVDLVFIDADHSYEAVIKDINKYTPKLREGGILCGHDIDYPGVNRAVNEMVPDHDVGPNFVWIKKGVLDDRSQNSNP
jgi:predicted O-methyltransferase YrrM